MTVPDGCKCDHCRERWTAHQRAQFGQRWPHNLNGVPSQKYWEAWPGLVHGASTVTRAELALCVLDESNDAEAFAALPDCTACEGTGKDVPADFRGPTGGGDTTP